MKYTFPEGLYTDVRIEHINSAEIMFRNAGLKNCIVKSYSAAFIRVFDGSRFWCANTTDINNLQQEIESLASLVSVKTDVTKLPIHNLFSSSRDTVMKFSESDVSKINLDDKLALVKKQIPLLEENKYLKIFRPSYLDNHIVKEFYNSKGADIKYDKQYCMLQTRLNLAEGKKKSFGYYTKSGKAFNEIADYENSLSSYIDECVESMLNSEPVEPGTYTVIFAPDAAGIFAHECFGHKSEADLGSANEVSEEEWAAGKKIAPANLSIIDDGSVESFGYTPYDDEGIKAKKNYLIKNGILAGKMHTVSTALERNEIPTGNARALSYEFEPIVRMTTTYIDKGTQTFEELAAGVGKGIFLKQCGAGSGLSTFSFSPILAYYIENGCITRPVKVSVIFGNVSRALSDIDGISDEVKLYSIIGCGKIEQMPLPIGEGGPYVRVRNLSVK